MWSCCIILFKMMEIERLHTWLLFIYVTYELLASVICLCKYGYLVIYLDYIYIYGNLSPLLCGNFSDCLVSIVFWFILFYQGCLLSSLELPSLIASWEMRLIK